MGFTHLFIDAKLTGQLPCYSFGTQKNPASSCELRGWIEQGSYKQTNKAPSCNAAIQLTDTPLV